MKVSTGGVLIAGATAAVVLTVGLVFVFQAGRAPAEKAVVAASPAADDLALSLEARRQARLAQSQAMLGGAKFPAEAPVPAPAAPEPPPPSPAPSPSPSGASPPPSPHPSPQKMARPAVTPVVEPLPAPAARPCTESGGNSPVAEACLTGGQPAAKQVMKRLVATARERGSRFTCEGCHLDQEAYKLREDARSEFARLLEVAK